MSKAVGYEENEILETTRDMGSVRKNTIEIPKGSEVVFIKVQDHEDLAEARIAVDYNGRILVLPENMVRFKSWFKRRRALKAFNKQMYKNSPRLRRYHSNPFIKVFFRIYYYFKKEE